METIWMSPEPIYFMSVMQKSVIVIGVTELEFINCTKNSKLFQCVLQL